MRLQRARSIALLLAAALSMAQTSPPTTAPHPKFTIGKDTTLIDGPLNPDGTINYVAAINKILGEGVTNENNAAIPLLSVSIGDYFDRQVDDIFQVLHARIPANRPSAQAFEFYMGKKKHPGKNDRTPSEEVQKYSDMLAMCESRPWKPEDQPEVAAWLNECEPAMTIVERAVQLPRYFVPWVSKESPPNALDGLPLFVGVQLVARDALIARSMLRLGQGNLPAALDDLGTLRRLCQLLGKEGNGIYRRQADRYDAEACRAYGLIANEIAPNPKSLEKIRAALTAFPPIPGSDPISDQVEPLSTLDMFMQVIRGDEQPLFKLLGGTIDPKQRNIETGDLSRVDWNIALKEAVRLLSLPSTTDSMPYADQLKMIDAQAKEAQPSLYNISDALMGVSSANRELSSPQAVEKFLKMQPDESRETYSKRIAAWLVGWDPGAGKRLLSLHEKCVVIRQLAVIAVDLADFRAARGSYPPSLDPLKEAAAEDPFSGKPLHYTATGDSFTLYSVGINGEDEDGKGDDIVIQVNR